MRPLFQKHLLFQFLLKSLAGVVAYIIASWLPQALVGTFCLILLPTCIADVGPLKNFWQEAGHLAVLLGPVCGFVAVLVNFLLPYFPILDLGAPRWQKISVIVAGFIAVGCAVLVIQEALKWDATTTSEQSVQHKVSLPGQVNFQ